jgi:hypothetical protein
MSDALFQIVFRGKLLSGISSEQARSNLAQLFRTDEQRIGVMLAQPKWIIKSGISKETAQKFQEALRNAGLMVAVMAEETNTPSDMTPEAKPEKQTLATLGQTSGQALSKAVIAQTPQTDTLLPQMPKPQPFAADLSAFSLADVGAIMDASAPKKAERDFAVVQFSLAAPGAQLIEKNTVAPVKIDTSALTLVAAEIPAQTILTALQREMEN